MWPTALTRPARLEGLDQARGRRGVAGERLLDEGGHAGLGELQADLEVEAGRRGDHARSRPRSTSSSTVATASPPATPCVSGRVGDTDEVDVRRSRAGRARGCVPSSRCRRGRPAAASSAAPRFASRVRRDAVDGQPQARSPTASTMRSRSPCDTEGCTGSDRHSGAACSVIGRSSSVVGGQPVDRDRVEHPGPMPSPRHSARSVAARDPDGVLVVDVLCAGGHGRHDDLGMSSSAEAGVRHCGGGVPSVGRRRSCTRPMAAWMSVIRLLSPTTSFSYCLHALVAQQPHVPRGRLVGTETMPPSPEVMFLVG